ncbi:MAG: M14 family zinc carboxypeptidase [Parvularculaceae bacterium]
MRLPAFLLAAFSFFALTLAAPTQAAAADDAPETVASDFWPGVRYDAGTPTLREVVGHAPGERITSPEDAIRYLRALADHARDRVRIYPYARTWQGRELVYAVIGSAEAIANLNAQKTGMAALADPRKTPQARADELVADLRAPAWIAYSVHGNEISPTDAGLLTAYHLLAARGDPLVDKILANTVFFIDPVQNPDGRARFLHHFNEALGLEPSGSRIAAERNEPWPTGRMNHYLFDMNRDWFVQSQPETLGRVRSYLEWRPVVFVDAHEMGTDQEYFFAPGSPPFNPNFGAGHRDKLMLYGRNNAKRFDELGFNYFTREIFDEFFPGYGSSWPAFTGAIPMVYEQSSARGLRAERTNGSRYAYLDTVMRHFVASMATLETTADNRESLLRRYYEFAKTAVEEGKSEKTRSFIIPATDDRAGARAMAAILARQGVEVAEATAAFAACGEDYKAGAFVVDLAQPAKRLARTLLDADNEMDAAFIKEQERLREKDLPNEIYDVTAWSLPATFGVATHACGANVDTSAGFSAFNGPAVAPGRIAGPGAAVAYVVDWGERPAVRLLSGALRDGLNVLSSDKAFTLDGRDYAAGTLVFRAATNPDDLRARLGALALETGAEVIGVASSWVTEGPNFGSFNMPRVPAPNVAIAWGSPTNPYFAGNTKFVIERQLGYPVAAVRGEDLLDKGLDQFDVLILPGEAPFFGDAYAGKLGPAGAARLKRWVEAGGSLVAIAGAVRWLADPANEMLSIRREDAYREKPIDAGDEDEDAPATVPGAILKTAGEARAAIAPDRAAPDGASGVLARAVVDPDHWLGAGLKPTVIAPLAGADIYTPVKLDRGANVVRFAGPQELVAAGYLWAETKAQFAHKPFVVAEPMGDGMIIAFTQSPTFRAHFDGLHVLVANAVLRAPAHSGKLRGR